jgi:hypothetical protein
MSIPGATTNPNANQPTAVKKEPVKTPDTGEKKEKKAKVKKEGATPRPRLPTFPDEHIITVLKENAKTRGANDRFNVYKTGMTVKQYLDIMAAEPWDRTNGQTFADMRWDADHKFINVGTHTVEVPKPAPAPEKQPAA